MVAARPRGTWAQLMRFNGAFTDAVVELERAVNDTKPQVIMLPLPQYISSAAICCACCDLDGADQAYATAVCMAAMLNGARSLAESGCSGAVVMVHDAGSRRQYLRHRLIPACISAARCQSHDEASVPQTNLLVSLKTLAVWPYAAASTSSSSVLHTMMLRGIDCRKVCAGSWSLMPHMKQAGLE